MGSPCERIGPFLDILAGNDRRFSFSEEDTFVLLVSALYQMNFILIEKQRNLNKVGESELAPTSNSAS
jgi:hypothetical protein